MKRHATESMKFGSGTYQDRGCPGRDGCERSLECHRPVCIFDITPEERNRQFKEQRYQRIKALLPGRSVKQIADILGMSDRVIYRALKDTRDVT